MAISADGKHILTDVYTTAGVLIGLFLVRQTGWYFLDGAVACAVAANILFIGARLVFESSSRLMHAYDPELLDQISAIIAQNRKPEWIDVHRLRAWRSGRQHLHRLPSHPPARFESRGCAQGSYGDRATSQSTTAGSGRRHDSCRAVYRPGVSHLLAGTLRDSQPGVFRATELVSQGSDLPGCGRQRRRIRTRRRTNPAGSSRGQVLIKNRCVGRRAGCASF